MLEKHIKEASDLYEWFQMAYNDRRLRIINGVCVSTAVRSEILLSVDAGSIIVAGTLYQIEFVDLGGDVWRAYINKDAE